MSQKQGRMLLLSGRRSGSRSWCARHDLCDRKGQHRMTVMTSAHEGMWHAWVCGMHGYVACMGMWHACVCGMHGYVACMGMRHAWVCGMHGYVACMGMWHAWVCGMRGYVPCMGMWHAWVCGMHGYVACMGMCHAWSSGILIEQGLIITTYRRSVLQGSTHAMHSVLHTHPCQASTHL
jgi:hypothetical protein